jgi:hypothetical protein
MALAHGYKFVNSEIADITKPTDGTSFMDVFFPEHVKPIKIGNRHTDFYTHPAGHKLSLTKVYINGEAPGERWVHQKAGEKEIRGAGNQLEKLL